MRNVTIHAAIDYRLMLPEERTALVGVAGVASFVEGILLEQARANGAMRIVTIRAHYLAGIDRMCGNLVAVGTLFLVTGKADLRLRLLRENVVLRRVNLVAVVAGYLVVLMGTAVPVGTSCSLVAIQALSGTILVIIGRIHALLEDVIRCRTSLAGGIALQVSLAIAVTGLAGWRSGVPSHAMLGLINRQDRRSLTFVMTTRANRVALKRILRRIGRGRTKIGVWQIAVCSKE